MNLTKTQTIILMFIFIAIGGLILYRDSIGVKFSPLDYVFKQ